MAVLQNKESCFKRCVWAIPPQVVFVIAQGQEEY